MVVPNTILLQLAQLFQIFYEYSAQGIIQKLYKRYQLETSLEIMVDFLRIFKMLDFSKIFEIFETSPVFPGKLVKCT